MSGLRVDSYNIVCRWTVNTLGMLIMSLLGEWLCVRRELADIPIGGCIYITLQGLPD
jgi:hypothetical protein